MQVTELQFEQGSEEWLEARLGKVTSSCFKHILGKPRSKTATWSDKAITYAYDIVAEMLTGDYVQAFGAPLDWGHDYEGVAINEYEQGTFTDVKKCSLFTIDGDIIGGSPDGLIGEDGIVEVKCPYNTTNQIKTVINGMPKEHMAQIQGNMFITGRKWCDFISFDPRIDGDGRIYVERIERDEEYITNLSEKLNDFTAFIMETYSKITGADNA